jgi:hypothetical protein
MSVAKLMSNNEIYYSLYMFKLETAKIAPPYPISRPSSKHLNLLNKRVRYSENRRFAFCLGDRIHCHVSFNDISKLLTNCLYKKQETNKDTSKSRGRHKSELCNDKSTFILHKNRFHAR